MDAWNLFCKLCQIVVKSQSVYLDVLITQNGIELMLMPLGDDYEEELEDS